MLIDFTFSGPSAVWLITRKVWDASYLLDFEDDDDGTVREHCSKSARSSIQYPNLLSSQAECQPSDSALTESLASREGISVGIAPCRCIRSGLELYERNHVSSPGSLSGDSAEEGARCRTRPSQAISCRFESLTHRSRRLGGRKNSYPDRLRPDVSGLAFSGRSI